MTAKYAEVADELSLAEKAKSLSYTEREIVTIASIIQAEARLPEDRPHFYLVLSGEQGMRRGMVYAEELRSAEPRLRVQTNCGGGSFKSQFKRADRSGAAYALVIGDEEAARQTVVIKPLRDTTEQIVESGDLSRRVPARRGAEELAQLGGLFNTLLERNEHLGTSMRHALDAVAHDLRTPLTRLRSRAELALSDPAVGEATTWLMASFSLR